MSLIIYSITLHNAFIFIRRQCSYSYMYIYTPENLLQHVCSNYMVHKFTHLHIHTHVFSYIHSPYSVFPAFTIEFLILKNLAAIL